MQMMTTALQEVLVTVRQTAAAHISALNEVERAFAENIAKLAAGQEAIEAERASLNARERTAIAEAREALDSDRADLEAERSRMAVVPQPSRSEDPLKLNVGGVRFGTSRATLTKVPESTLAAMFQPPRLDSLQRDPGDGSIFLDRDGERFGLVLDFLRDGGTSQLAKTITQMPEPRHEAMLRELEFFGLADAVFPPRPWIDDAEFKAWGGELTSVRVWCAAVLHGRSVVVFGGMDGNSMALNTTKMLDLDAADDGTATEASFTAAGPSMSTARFGCAAVRLDARRVLVVGGSGRLLPVWYKGSLDTTEILDLETMRFSPGPPMLAKRFGCAAVALDSGRILVAGGVDENNVPHTYTEILDVATMTFALGPALLSARSGCAAVALENPRRALILGGRGMDNMSLNTTEILDLDTMTFSHGPTMRTARYGCAAVTVGGYSRRRCLVIGTGTIRTKLDTTEVLDLETMEFSVGPAMLEERLGCAAVVDAERVFVLGGARGYPGGLSTAGSNTVDTEVLAAAKATVTL